MAPIPKAAAKAASPPKPDLEATRRIAEEVELEVELEVALVPLGEVLSVAEVIGPVDPLGASGGAEDELMLLEDEPWSMSL